MNSNNDYVTVPRAQLQYIRDLLTEKVYGSSARSPGHNARLVVDDLLSAAPPVQMEAVAPTCEVDWRASYIRARDALYQFQYPPDPKMLREIADEIDCGSDCEHGHTEWDTNAHVCSRSESKDGCASEKAWHLRQFADAIEARAEIVDPLAPASPVPSSERDDIIGNWVKRSERLPTVGGTYLVGAYDDTMSLPRTFVRFWASFFLFDTGPEWQIRDAEHEHRTVEYWIDLPPHPEHPDCKPAGRVVRDDIIEMCLRVVEERLDAILKYAATMERDAPELAQREKVAAAEVKNLAFRLRSLKSQPAQEAVGLSQHEVPSPDTIVRYDSGEFAPVMFHYAAETANMKDTAQSNGFDLKIIEMQSELDDDHPLSVEYADGSHEVVGKWTPPAIDGWKLVSKTDTENGPIAAYVRPRSSSQPAQEAE